MKFKPEEPPRTFNVGRNGQIEIKDCGKIVLDPDEQITFVTPDGREHDFAAKSWGFYATPSVNGRLVAQGFKTALVRNAHGRYYVMVVDRARMDDFEEYVRTDQQQIIEWLDERT